MHIGHEGATEGVRKQIQQALADHELIKIKLGSECPQSRFEVAELLAAEPGVKVAQILGQDPAALQTRSRAATIRIVRLPALAALLAAVSTASGCATLLRRPAPAAAPTGAGQTGQPTGDASPPATPDTQPAPDGKPGAPTPGRVPGARAPESFPRATSPNGCGRSPVPTSIPCRCAGRRGSRAFSSSTAASPATATSCAAGCAACPRTGPRWRRRWPGAGLPRGLIFVAMIESRASPRARSRTKGAGGFWQFIPDVARGYGLEVSFWVDERRDLAKSTDAAAIYLGDLYHRFGSWELALAGYNAGFHAVLTSMLRFNTNDFWTLCQLEAGLPWETTEYVPKVLAVAIVERNQSAFGFEDVPVESAPPLRIEISVGAGSPSRPSPPAWASASTSWRRSTRPTRATHAARSRHRHRARAHGSGREQAARADRPGCWRRLRSGARAARRDAGADRARQPDRAGSAEADQRRGRRSRRHPRHGHLPAAHEKARSRTGESARGITRESPPRGPRTKPAAKPATKAPAAATGRK